MSRVAVVGTPFKCLELIGDGEVEGLHVDVFSDPTGTALGTLTPEPSVDVPGVQTAYWTFDSSGTYYLHWYTDGDPGAGSWQTVFAVESVAHYPVILPAGRLPNASSGVLPSSVVAVGRPWHPEYAGTTGQTLGMTVYGPDMAALSGTPVALVEYGPGVYRSILPLTPLASGPHLCIVFSQPYTVVGHDFQDVFSPVESRFVSIGVKGMDNQGYAGVHVTLTNSAFPDRVAMTFTGPDGIARFSLDDGDYLVTFRDPRYPGRTFTLNNFVFTVSDPVDDTTNAITYQLAWLDVIPIDDLRVPVEHRSVMHVRVLVGPDGVPSAYKTFTVELLAPWRRGSLFVATGSKEYRLDQAGASDIALIRGSRVRVSFPEADGTLSFTVPDEAEFDITDIHVDSPFGVTVPSIFYPYKSAVR